MGRRRPATPGGSFSNAVPRAWRRRAWHLDSADPARGAFAPSPAGSQSGRAIADRQGCELHPPCTTTPSCWCCCSPSTWLGWPLRGSRPSWSLSQMAVARERRSATCTFQDEVGLDGPKHRRAMIDVEKAFLRRVWRVAEFHADFPFPRTAAPTIARMPALRASGRAGQAETTAARSASWVSISGANAPSATPRRSGESS